MTVEFARSPAAITRPMLSRVADSLYWMSRYMERSEHIARVLLETQSLLTDIGDLDPLLRRDHWRAVLKCLCCDDESATDRLLGASEENMAQQVAAFLTLDVANSNSILSCLISARENARSIREKISGEMWENLNMLYWSLRADDARAKFDEAPQETHRQVMMCSALFQGLTDQTLAHGQSWLFTQVGKYIERMDMISRIIAAKHAILGRSVDTMDDSEQSIHWMSILRSCAPVEAYRRLHMGDTDPRSIVDFLLLERYFPQSIRYCVHHAHDCVTRVRASMAGHGVDAAERVLGRLRTQLEYAEPEEILRTGLPQYIRQIQDGATQAAAALREMYFLH